MDTVQTIVVAVISSGIVGSILVFVQFLITRHDKKAEKNSEVIKAIDALGEKVDKLEKKIDAVEEKGYERDAIQARIRILRCSDELRGDEKHTKEWFDQVMSDITIYEAYVSTHPNFKNGQAEATIQFFKNVYAERLEKRDFL